MYLCLLSGGVSGHSSKRCVGGYTLTESVSVFVVRWCIKTQCSCARDVLGDAVTS